MSNRLNIIAYLDRLADCEFACALTFITTDYFGL